MKLSFVISCRRFAIESAGIPGLHNGLSEADNHKLFETDDIDEMVALVLRGLKEVFAGGRDSE